MQWSKLQWSKDRKFEEEKKKKKEKFAFQYCNMITTHQFQSAFGKREKLKEGEGQKDYENSRLDLRGMVNWVLRTFCENHDYRKMIESIYRPNNDANYNQAINNINCNK